MDRSSVSRWPESPCSITLAWPFCPVDCTDVGVHVFDLRHQYRKHAWDVEGTVGLTVETFLLTPIALGFLLYWGNEGQLVFGHLGWEMNTLVVLSGVVTSIPLIFFALKQCNDCGIVTIGFFAVHISDDRISDRGANV